MNVFWLEKDEEMVHNISVMDFKNLVFISYQEVPASRVHPS